MESDGNKGDLKSSSCYLISFDQYDETRMEYKYAEFGEKDDSQYIIEYKAVMMPVLDTFVYVDSFSIRNMV